MYGFFDISYVLFILEWCGCGNKHSSEVKYVMFSDICLFLCSDNFKEAARIVSTSVNFMAHDFGAVEFLIELL